MPREFKFRGYTIDKLQDISMDDFIGLLKARQRRSLRRGLTVEERKLLEKIRAVKENSAEGEQSETIKTHVRTMTILPEMVGMKVMVHNGKDFIPVEILPEMVGHYLGEFAVTNKPVKHGTPGIGASRSSMYVPLK